MGVRGFKDHEVTQPARLELIGGGVEDATIGKLVPAVLPAHSLIEQAQAPPATWPAELRLESCRHVGAAGIVGAAVLEANPPSKRQDGCPIDGCTRLNHGLRPPSSWLLTREVEVPSVCTVDTSLVALS